MGPLGECVASCFGKRCVQLSANNLLGSDVLYVMPEETIVVARLLAIVWKLSLLRYDESQRTNSQGLRADFQ